MKNIDLEVYKDYLHDLGWILKDEAIEAKRRYDKNPNDAYSSGYSLAFQRVISLMQQQARPECFDIPLKDLGLDDIDADKDLL